MDEKNKLITIIVPCRNEEKPIVKCLDSIISNNYPKHRIEILIVDGMSNDGTRNALERYIKQYSFIKLLHNASKNVPTALNIGIKKARGKIIMRMDAHATCKDNYISSCVKYLNKTGADNVGGVIEHMGSGFMGKAIALAQKCKFGLGGAKFRSAKKEQYVDTVFPGCWPRKVFDKYGYFDEKLIRNQDIEFNSRIRKGGGEVFLTPEIKLYYHCRSNLKDLWLQNFRNGFWNIKTTKIAPGSLSIRHFVPLLFVAALLTTWIIKPLWMAVVASYVLCNLFFSLELAIKNGFTYFFIIPLVFLVLHLSYGLGSLVGVFTLVKLNHKN